MTKATKIQNHNKAIKLAKEYHPIIYQEWINIYDFITLMMLDKYPDNLQWYTRILSKKINSPTLYFKAMEDLSWYYLSFMVYHFWDWSNNSIYFIKDLCSHQHDTESILMRISKKPCGLFSKKPKIDICTVFHKSFIFKKNSDRKVIIQPKGHGIRPLESGNLEKSKYNIIKYTIFDFENLTMKTDSWWTDIKKKLNGTNTPNEQYDTIMRAKFCTNRYLHNHEPGDNWNRPDILFEHAKILGKI